MHGLKQHRMTKIAGLLFITLAVVASPLSVSLGEAGTGGLTANIANAQTNPCPAGSTASAQTNFNSAGLVVMQPFSTQAGCTNNTTGVFTPAPTSCASILAFMTSPFTCMFRTLVSLTAATFIYVSSWILTIAGLLFNWLVTHTIIEFGNVYSSIKDAVELAWSAFRDIANILIIGIFTFIAISIIVGLKEYGQKKLIANVLIIAVLINFSLLFTKMIIDGSNFAATQIYNAASLGGPANQTASGVVAGDAGISGRFLQLMGVQTGWDAVKTVAAIAEAKDSGWVALWHGLFIAAVLLGAAGVLLYGSFLIVSRMVMLIFLFVTASIAFASYLVPKWS